MPYVCERRITAIQVMWNRSTGIKGRKERLVTSITTFLCLVCLNNAAKLHWKAFNRRRVNLKEHFSPRPKFNRLRRFDKRNVRGKTNKRSLFSGVRPPRSPRAGKKNTNRSKANEGEEAVRRIASHGEGSRKSAATAKCFPRQPPTQRSSLFLIACARLTFRLSLAEKSERQPASDCAICGGHLFTTVEPAINQGGADSPVPAYKGC